MQPVRLDSSNPMMTRLYRADFYSRCAKGHVGSVSLGRLGCQLKRASCSDFVLVVLACLSLFNQRSMRLHAHLSNSTPQPGPTCWCLLLVHRDEENTVRSMRDAAVTSEFSRSATYKVTLPLGKNGLDTNPSANWKSDQAANFVKHTWDIAGVSHHMECMGRERIGPSFSVSSRLIPFPSYVVQGAHHEEERKETATQAA